MAHTLSNIDIQATHITISFVIYQGYTSILYIAVTDKDGCRPPA